MEHDNIRSALGWAVESNPESALRMVSSLATFWLSRRYITEGCKWCQAAISRAEVLALAGSDIDQKRAQAYSALARLSINRGEYQTGQIAARLAVALARQFKDPYQLARALNLLGMASTFTDDVALAFDSLHESEALCRKFGYNEELALVLQSLVYATLEIYGPKANEQLHSYLEESLVLSRGSVDPEAAVRTEGTLARPALYRWDMAEARKHADLMLDLHGEISSASRGIRLRWHMLHGKWEIMRRRLRYIVKPFPIGGRLGTGAVAHQLECLAFIAMAQERAGLAVKLLSAAEALRELSNSLWTPPERIEYDRELVELRAGMDGTTFRFLWAEDQCMNMDGAINFAGCKR